MKPRPNPIKPKSLTQSEPMFLGIEAGATRCVAILADSKGVQLQRIEVEKPSNLRLLDDSRLLELFQEIAAQLPSPAKLGIGMAGALDDADRDRIRTVAARIWPDRPCWAGNDLETALSAAGDGNESSNVARIVVISGTGASCCGRDRNGKLVLTGGWGHLLGDRGSGYEISLSALQAVFQDRDQTGSWPALGTRFLTVLGLKSPDDLVAWVGAAGKSAVAALAVEVFAAAAARDRIARRILDGSAAMISSTAVACAQRVASKGKPVEFVLTGSVLQKQPGFARKVGSRLKSGWTGAAVKSLTREGAWGAVILAKKETRMPSHLIATQEQMVAGCVNPESIEWIPRSRGISPTEQRNPRSRKLDRMTIRNAIRLMLTEDATIPDALMREEKHICKAVEIIVHAFQNGGRLFYIGAGTSGRLGALDAYECPPTFSVSPEMTQAIVAGGDQALTSAQEDAEDDMAGGADAVRNRGVTDRDVVVGIAASGSTPFMWGGLHAAREAGAHTILVCFNPDLVFKRGTRPTLVIAPKIGPEVLTGSTRLKAGTATKLLLNIFTTLSMVRLGKVVENLMVDVQPTNAKLRERAIRIVRELTGVSHQVAEDELQRNDWSVKRSIQCLKGGKART